MCGVWDTRHSTPPLKPFKAVPRRESPLSCSAALLSLIPVPCRGSPKARMVLRGHDGTVHGCCYWPGGKEICTVSNDRTMMVWDADDGQALMRRGPDHTSKLCCSGSEALRVVSRLGVSQHARARMGEEHIRVHTHSTALPTGPAYHDRAQVAVAGGENKSLFGADFRVTLWGIEGVTLTPHEENAGQGNHMPPSRGDATEHHRGDADRGGAEKTKVPKSDAGHPLLEACPSEEDIEDFSLGQCIERAKACRDAAKSLGEGALRARLAMEGKRILGEVDDDSPKNVRELWAELADLE